MEPARNYVTRSHWELLSERKGSTPCTKCLNGAKGPIPAANHQEFTVRLWCWCSSCTKRRSGLPTPCTKCLWANGARRPQPAPNDHQIHCGAAPTLIRYKRKFEFHQKLTTTWNATNFWISNVHYTSSLDSLLIFVVGPNFSMTLLKMI